MKVQKRLEFALCTNLNEVTAIPTSKSLTK